MRVSPYPCGTESLLPFGIEILLARVKPPGTESLLASAERRRFIASSSLHDGLDLPLLEVGIDERSDGALILFAKTLDGLEL